MQQVNVRFDHREEWFRMQNATTRKAFTGQTDPTNLKIGVVQKLMYFFEEGGHEIICPKCTDDMRFQLTHGSHLHRRYPVAIYKCKMDIDN